MHHSPPDIVGYHLDEERQRCSIGQLDVDAASVGPEADAMAFGGYHPAILWQCFVIVRQRKIFNVVINVPVATIGSTLVFPPQNSKPSEPL